MKQWVEERKSRNITALSYFPQHITNIKKYLVNELESEKHI